jgi:hypothetical protein
MIVSVEVPDEFVHTLVPEGQDPARALLEAIALEGYRRDRLSEADIRRLLGFQTRMKVHSFLKESGAYTHYTVEAFEHDRQVARQVAQAPQKSREQKSTSERQVG